MKTIYLLYILSKAYNPDCGCIKLQTHVVVSDSLEKASDYENVFKIEIRHEQK